MCTKFFLAATLVVAIFLSACNRDSVSLSFTNAKDEVPQLSNLVFRFSKALVADSLLNFWDSTEYVSFEPNIKGRFRWESPDELVFSPSQPLSAATDYKAKIKDEVLRYTKYNSVKQTKDIAFHTASLQLSDAQVSWVLQDESGNKALPQFNLHFNYPVKPEDLKDKLSVEVEGP
jgi:alpha-2-macroglobulin